MSPAKENVPSSNEFPARVYLRTYYDFLIGVFVDETKRFELSHLNGHDRRIRADKLRPWLLRDCHESEKLFFF